MATGLFTLSKVIIEAINEVKINWQEQWADI
jgi:hypothetical protein